MSAVKARSVAKENSARSPQLTPDRSAASETVYWMDSVPIYQQAFLHDHRVAGRVVYPAAGFSMAGIAVHRALQGSQCEQRATALKDLKFRHALALSDLDPTVLQLCYRPGNDEFTVYSRRHDCSGPLTLHASGRLGQTEAAISASGVELEDKFTRCCESVDVASFYRRLDKSGLDYGPFFQSIKFAQVARLTGEAITRLACHPELAMTQDLWAQPVTLLDSAFQSLAATLDVDDFELYVPLRIKSLTVHGDLSSDLWCYARLVKVTSRAVIGDLTLFDLNGRPLIEISGLHCLRTAWKQSADISRTAQKKYRGNINIASNCF